MEITFNGKRALVTGASQGIGKGIALALAKGGAKVIALDIKKELLEKLKGEEPTVEILVADLSNWNQTKEVIKSAFPIDLLVNNAGICILQSLREVTEESYDRTFNVNTKAVINVTQTIVNHLLERNAPGSIVNMSSQAAKCGLLHHTLYCASKGSVDAFTRALALEVGPNQIRVNCINPTVVMTELGRNVWSDPALGDPMKAKIPLRRFAEIEDVTNAVLFLLSDKANMITGISMPVDGGYLAC